MKVTFVYPDQVPADPGWTGHYYCGIGVLSAVLKRAGFETSLIHVTRPDARDEDFVARLDAEKPDLLAFSCTTFAFRLATRLAGLAKQIRPDLPTVCGGIHPTMSPEEVIEARPFDVVCRGEGERALMELAQRIARGERYTDIQNLWVRDGDTVHQNPIRPLIQDLDSLPFSDREIFDYANLHWERRGWAVVMMTRGCGHACTYCANHTLKKLYDGERYVRFRSVDSVMAELKEILNRYDFIHSIHFDDDNPFVNPHFVGEFCEKYKREIGIPFRFNLRPNAAHEDRLRLLKDAGGVEAKIGLESGNERILNDVLGRRLTVSQVKDAFGACHRAGLKTHSFNMVGIPEETPATILDTIKLNARVSSDIIQVSIFFPFPGTDLWVKCRDMGLMPDHVPVDFFTDTTLDHKTVTKRQVEFYHRYFHHLVRIYKWALGSEGDNSGWRVRFLDWSLSFEPARRAWALALGTALPGYRFLRRKRARV